jgi:hypothetical protein
MYAPNYQRPVSPPQSRHPYPHPAPQGHARGGDVDFFGGVVASGGTSVGGSGSYQQHQQQRMLPQAPAQSVNIHRTFSNQSASSLGSRSSYNRKVPAILNDPTIAPPPKCPESLIAARKFAPDGRSSPRNLPNFDLIKHSGDCVARLSLKSMITKKWRQAFWAAYGDHAILFFRSRNDFEEWVSNPLLSAEARDELVKLNIDFKNHMQMGNVLGYKLSGISCKQYGRAAGLMYQFKVDKWYTHGPSISAAVGGKNDMEVRNLRSIMGAMMELHPQNVLRDDAVYNDVSSYGSSSVSKYSARSIESAHSPRSHSSNAQQQYDLSGAQRPSSPGSMGGYAQQPPAQQPSQQQPYQYDLGAQVPNNSTKYWNGQEQQRPRSAVGAHKKRWFGKNQNQRMPPEQARFSPGRPTSPQQAGRYQHGPAEINYGR